MEKRDVRVEYVGSFTNKRFRIVLETSFILFLFNLTLRKLWAML